jgi:hypothetical protein
MTKKQKKKKNKQKEAVKSKTIQQKGGCSGISSKCKIFFWNKS